MKAKEWYLGLDIGTNSVGFSATDTEYNILTKSGMLQCGARLFDEAQTAEKRRGFRSVRRRIARCKVRLNLLYQLFKEVIEPIDPMFFIRLNERNKDPHIKMKKSNYPLFNDSTFTDREYYGNFPTIYHLRKHLLENDITDPRLLYLACHHIIKYRGHFLYHNFKTDRTHDTYDTYIDKISQINENIHEHINDTLSFTIPDNLKGIINDKSKSSSILWDEIRNKLNPQDKVLKAIFTAMRGNKIPLDKIWEDLEDVVKENNEILTNLKFSSKDYEECLAFAKSILNLSVEQLDFLALLREFFDLVRLDRVMMGEIYISYAMVKRYDEHKDDLDNLKEFVKKYIPNEYDKMFRGNEESFAQATYTNYIGSNLHRKKVVSHCEICVKNGEDPTTAKNYKSFLEYTRNLIDKVDDKVKGTDDYKNLIFKIEKETLCQIHNTSDNSIVPYQLNEKELVDILERQKGNFVFLQNTDDDGSITEKIVKLLTFRIPYYVGPLSEKHKGKFAWIVKKNGYENAKVLPWNFEKVVDKAACGESFIRRMTAKCTYLKSEDVIPKQSLLYQKFMLLQDLNNLKVNNDRISQEMKMLLYKGICQKKINLSKKAIKDYLVEIRQIDTADTVGKETENDKAFNSSLSSLIKFRGILGDNIDESMCENIILWHTVFGDEKEQVILKITTQYGWLTAEQIDKLSRLSFKGWARFSSKFLSGITTSKCSNHEEKGLTIIKLLEETTSNLMEILNSDNYLPKFLDIVKEENAYSKDIEINYNFVDALYCSPSVKRSIWQAILISKELTKINGNAPKKVFIEVTRKKDKKLKGKMKSSRRKQIDKLLTKALKTARALTSFTLQDKKAIKDDFNGKQNEKEFRSDKLYLYFTQLGRCMYTGETIVLDDLYNNSIYDIDHIYPKSKIKDDSLTNRVLVKRVINKDKDNIYPIDPKIQKAQSSFWKMLRDKKLICDEKYKRLVCKEPLTDDIIGSFINRQLVSTNQAVKETANALGILFGDATKVIYCKASHVSDFRHTYELVKCREVNNLHHAHDAYLNIVVGNVWNGVHEQYWNKNITFNEDHALDKLFKTSLSGVWRVSYIGKIKDYLFNNKKYLNKYIVTSRPKNSTQEKHKGAFYEQTIHPKGKGQFEIHEGYDTAKYGGYKAGFAAYNCVIEYDNEKGKRIRGIFTVPVRFIGRYSGDDLAQKVAQENGIAERTPKLIISKIPISSVLEIDGIRYQMNSGKLDCPAVVEWYPDYEIITIIHDILKYKKIVANHELTVDENTFDDIPFGNLARNKHQREGKLISRENNLKVFDAILEQIKKPFYSKYSFAKKVNGGKIDFRSNFMALKTYRQVEQLINLLNFITTNKDKPNTKAIGGDANETPKYRAGGIANDISSHSVYLITQSVTGLFEKKIDLNS